MFLTCFILLSASLSPRASCPFLSARARHNNNRGETLCASVSRHAAANRRLGLKGVATLVQSHSGSHRSAASQGLSGSSRLTGPRDCFFKVAPLRLAPPTPNTRARALQLLFKQQWPLLWSDLTCLSKLLLMCFVSLNPCKRLHIKDTQPHLHIC